MASKLRRPESDFPILKDTLSIEGLTFHLYEIDEDLYDIVWEDSDGDTDTINEGDPWDYSPGKMPTEKEIRDYIVKYKMAKEIPEFSVIR